MALFFLNTAMNRDEGENLVNPPYEKETFWRIRSAKYDKLYWTKDQNYLEKIIQLADLKNNHLVLDVGTGTGAVANYVKQFVEHVVAVDISNSMLEKGHWTGTSVVKWDIGESLFINNIFDRVFARMVFHHILERFNRSILRCYDLLKEGGKFILAEGVPPNDNPEIVEWYTEMFRHKEERRTFTPDFLEESLREGGFQNIVTKIYYMHEFSVDNWLKNSGLEETTRNDIFQMHVQAPPQVKEAYHMQFTENDCLIRTKNIIMVAEK